MSLTSKDLEIWADLIKLSKELMDMAAPLKEKRGEADSTVMKLSGMATIAKQAGARMLIYRNKLHRMGMIEEELRWVREANAELQEELSKYNALALAKTEGRMDEAAIHMEKYIDNLIKEGHFNS